MSNELLSESIKDIQSKYMDLGEVVDSIQNEGNLFLITEKIRLIYEIVELAKKVFAQNEAGHVNDIDWNDFLQVSQLVLNELVSGKYSNAIIEPAAVSIVEKFTLV